MNKIKPLLLIISIFLIGKSTAQCCDHDTDIRKNEYQEIAIAVFNSFINCPQTSWISSLYSADTCFIYTLSPELDSLLQVHNPKLIIRNQYSENTWFCGDFYLYPLKSAHKKYEEAKLLMGFRTKKEELSIEVSLRLDDDK